MTVLATAGHVDHGKSTLVIALTGTDPDRFPEEKARGLTIDLGFAAATLDGDLEVSFVDVPGHVRYLPNMLAGVGGVDGCLFVVAATEGWKPQSEEHLRILELVGITDGVVALTKVGLVDADTAELAALEVVDRLGGSPLAGAPVVSVDAPAGVGVEELRHELASLVGRLPGAADRDRARLWVDRTFAAHGSGTVVTGTLTGGRLAVGDEVSVRPSGRTARVRALQHHGRSVESIEPGNRVAVNLAGVDRSDTVRGTAIVHSDRWVATTMVDASLAVLPSLEHEVTRRGAYAMHVGTAELACRIRVLGPDSVPPGGTGFVRLHLPVPVALEPGDRFVLREHGRDETVGGGEVLDVAPVVPASRARPAKDRLVEERGWVRLEEMEALSGDAAWRGQRGWACSEEARAEALRSIEAKGGVGLDEREAWVASTLPKTAPSIQFDDAYLAALEAAPFKPPPPDGVDRARLQAMRTRGLVLESGGVWFARLAVEEAARIAAGLLRDTPSGVTLSQLREAWGTSRKWAVPLASILDAEGMTRRRGDLRIAGPRLPAPN